MDGFFSCSITISQSPATQTHTHTQSQSHTHTKVHYPLLSSPLYSAGLHLRDYFSGGGESGLWAKCTGVHKKC